MSHVNNIFVNSMSKGIIIAIDGQSGTGKSTLAKQLAKKLGYLHVDSGAMYRAITLFFIRHHVDIHNDEEVQQSLDRITIKFKPDDDGEQRILLNEHDVTEEIRQLDVVQNVSAVAALASVRSFAVAEQRRLGEHKSVVMDGRDIGTTVFPAAELKIFLRAEDDVRAMRRYREMKEKGIATTLDEVKENLRRRDDIDSHREISPLRKAEDAIVVDNSNLTKDELLQEVMDIVGKRV